MAAVTTSRHAEEELPAAAPLMQGWKLSCTAGWLVRGREYLDSGDQALMTAGCGIACDIVIAARVPATIVAGAKHRVQPVVLSMGRVA